MEPIAYFSRMKPNAAPRRGSAVALALLAVSVVFAPLAGAKSEEVARAPSGVMYVTGGVGSEAVDRLKSMEKDFNLKLVFARTSGAYLSDVKLTLVDASGRALLDITSEGPLLMAKLPPGSYQIDATFNGHPETRKVTVAADKLVTVDFRWPRD
jgi:hypothetical protein